MGNRAGITAVGALLALGGAFAVTTAQSDDPPADVLQVVGADGESFDCVEPCTITRGTTTTTTLPPTTTTEPPTTTTTEPPTTTTSSTTSTTSTTTTLVPTPVALVFAEDTVITEELVLGPGDSIELQNGARLSFADGGYATWLGTPPEVDENGDPLPTWSVEYGTDTEGNRTAEITQNLERDINIFGEGDIRFESGSLASTIRYVAIALQPSIELGHYPLHWHHAGDGSRGTLVEGVVIQNSTNRAYVPHASHGITITDSIAANITGAGFWWDLPQGGEGLRRNDTSNNSDDIIIDRMLVNGTNGDAPPVNCTGYLLGAGSGNVIRDSVAANIHQSGLFNCSGYHWPSQANMNIGGTVWIFEDNVSINTQDGIFVWQNDPGNPHIVTRFTAINASDAGVEHGAYINDYHYQDIVVDTFNMHATSWTMAGGSIGHLRAERHTIGGPITIVGTQIGEFTIANARNGTGNAADYTLTDTGLTCDDVELEAVANGTTLTIDGVPCNLTGGV